MNGVNIYTEGGLMKQPITAKIYRDKISKDTLVYEGPYSGEGPFSSPPLPAGWYTCVFVDADGCLYFPDPLVREEKA